eukprot:jgi/Botrbrau1/3886/Bobra.0183s0107.1
MQASDDLVIMAGPLITLPTDVLISICSKLAVKDLLALACTCKNISEVLKDDRMWREIAMKKWGCKVCELAKGRCLENGWAPYCKHRLSFVTNVPSPLNLIQEDFSDPWEHLVCCLLCSRTSGSAIVKETILGFLAAFPTPTAVLEADPKALKEAINPVGLQDIRCKALRAMSDGFLSTDWEAPSAFYGCGPFAVDSWRIFCKGDTSRKNVVDPTLKRYLRWRCTGKAVACKSSSTGSRTTGKRRREGVLPCVRVLRSRRR